MTPILTALTTLTILLFAVAVAKLGLGTLATVGLIAAGIAAAILFGWATAVIRRPEHPDGAR